MMVVAVVTGKAHLVRKYEHARFSSLEIALLARRFAPRLVLPIPVVLLLHGAEVNKSDAVV